ncbi:MAG: CD225/dispanin family protein [Muribaculaceae bacterium]|nr:CD225/dispanin family protein [Muribaculaceae bacterium]
MKKIAIFASGNGSNAENIYQFFSNGNRVRVPLVIYDRINAGVADRMAKYPDVKTVYIPKSTWQENPQEIIDLLRHEEIDLIVMAGFLRFAPKELTEAFAGRMLNIHPSLIPAHCGPGMYGDKVHQAVIAAGDAKSGVTVHYVSDIIDGGEILMQEEVEVAEGETAESLAQKIHEVEYSLYPRAIVAALARLDSQELNPPAIPGVTPPPTPSPAEEWAETLGVSYNPEKICQTDNSAENLQNTLESNQNPEQFQSQLQSQLQNPQQPGIPAGSRTHYPTEPGQSSGQLEEKMPSTYLVWSVVMTLLCCLPAGVVAIIYSCQVSSKFYAGDFAGAMRASERAQIWIIISFVLGVMVNTLYFPLMMLF